MDSTIGINLLQATQFLVILLTGLVAGLFYGYDCSVVKGLGLLKDEAYLQSFQHINSVIQRPYFFVSFMGSLLLLPVASWLNYYNGNYTAFYLLLAATLIYFIGVFGVTIAFNVPLNEKLDQFNINTATASAIADMRSMFEAPWKRYNSTRTAASVLAFVLTIFSLLKEK